MVANDVVPDDEVKELGVDEDHDQYGHSENKEVGQTNYCTSRQHIDTMTQHTQWGKAEEYKREEVSQNNHSVQPVVIRNLKPQSRNVHVYIIPLSHYRWYNLLDKTPLSFNYRLTSLCEPVIQ